MLTKNYGGEIAMRALRLKPSRLLSEESLRMLRDITDQQNQEYITSCVRTAKRNHATVIRQKLLSSELNTLRGGD